MPSSPMGKGRQKRVAGLHTAAGAKGPAKQFVSSAAVLPGADTSSQRIAWRFCHVDSGGPWSFGHLTFAEIMDKLASFESMTIHELFSKGEEPGKHYEVAALPTKVARDRLEELQLSDMTRISRLRLSGKERLYGFLEDNCFHIVWWDPEHTVWPSRPRNT